MGEPGGTSYAYPIPDLRHYVGDGNIALCDGRNVDRPARGWASVWIAVTCEACLSLRPGADCEHSRPQAP